MFQVRSDKNWPVQGQKKARSLKFKILKDERLCYPRRKRAVHLYCTADLHLWFRFCKKLILLMMKLMYLGDSLTDHLKVVFYGNAWSLIIT